MNLFHHPNLDPTNNQQPTTQATNQPAANQQTNSVAKGFKYICYRHF